MILPILALGHPILKNKCAEIDQSFPGLEILIRDMRETMLGANGCGLAAPQVGKAIRIFIVDSKSTFENLSDDERKIYFDKHDNGIAETFINAEIVWRSEETWDDEEGCLSIPGLSETVNRSWSITISYRDANFEQKMRTFTGATARMIQHEYDHVEGILYLDHLSPLKKRLLKSRLTRVIKGQVKAKYPMKFV